MLGSRDPGPCPVCGEAHSACTPETVKESGGVTVTVGQFERDTDRIVRTVDMQGRDVVDPRSVATGFVSAEDVLEPMPGREGAFTTKYKKGWPVPLIEAVRQGIVEVEQLTQDQREELKRQADSDPAAKAALVESLKAKRPLNKMVEQDETVQKGVSEHGAE